MAGGLTQVEWIFFDCFNTLLDEADRLNGEHGMGPIADLPVRSGHFPNRAAWIDAYLAWRTEAWRDGDYREIALPERLGAILGREETALIEAMTTAFEPGFMATLTVSPGVREVLMHCRKRYRLAVVSNIFVPGLPRRALQRFGLLDCFEFVSDSAEVGYKKPAPEIYADALNRAAAKPEQVLFVGDNLTNDVLAPERLGIRAAWFNRSTKPAASDNTVEFNAWSNFVADILERTD